MVFNATFNNISVISWWSVLLREETRVPGENYRPAASHRQTLLHNVALSTSCHEWNSNLTLMAIGTDFIGSYKFYSHMIMTTTAPHRL